MQRRSFGFWPSGTLEAIEETLMILRRADAIVLDEIRNAGLYKIRCVHGLRVAVEEGPGKATRTRKAILPKGDAAKVWSFLAVPGGYHE